MDAKSHIGDARLHVSPVTVRRWVRSGRLPGRVLAWLKRGVGRAASRRSEPGSVPQGRFLLSEAIARGGVHSRIEGSSPPQVLRELVVRLRLPAAVGRDDLLDQLLQRERLASTGVGGGVALPHPRCPMERVPEGGMIAVGYPSIPLDWGALDGKPVDLIFLLLSPRTQTHLSLLSRAALFLRRPEYSSLVRDGAETDAVVASAERFEVALAAGHVSMADATV